MSAPQHEGLRQRVKLRATAQEVWSALTDAEQRPRWRSLSSALTPGDGGEIRDLVPGPQRHEQVARIEGWSEQALLVLRRERSLGGVTRSIQERWRMDVRGGAVHLHVDQEGFGMDEAGRALAAGTARSTELELRVLRHALERHPGIPRCLQAWRGHAETDAAALWARLFGPEGLAGPDSWLPERLGDRYCLHPARGPVLEGCLQIHTPPLDFAGTVQELDEGFLCLRVDPGEGASLELGLSTFGMDQGRLAGVAVEFEALLDGLGLDPRPLVPAAG